MNEKLLEYSVNIMFSMRPLQNVTENLEQCTVDYSKVARKMFQAKKDPSV